MSLFHCTLNDVSLELNGAHSPGSKLSFQVSIPHHKSFRSKNQEAGRADCRVLWSEIFSFDLSQLSPDLFHENFLLMTFYDGSESVGDLLVDFFSLFTCPESHEILLSHCQQGWIARFKFVSVQESRCSFVLKYLTVSNFQGRSGSISYEFQHNGHKTVSTEKVPVNESITWKLKQDLVPLEISTGYSYLVNPDSCVRVSIRSDGNEVGSILLQTQDHFLKYSDDTLLEFEIDLPEGGSGIHAKGAFFFTGLPRFVQCKIGSHSYDGGLVHTVYNPASIPGAMSVLDRPVTPFLYENPLCTPAFPVTRTIFNLRFHPVLRNIILKSTGHSSSDSSALANLQFNVYYHDTDQQMSQPFRSQPNGMVIDSAVLPVLRTRTPYLFNVQKLYITLTDRVTSQAVYNIIEIPLQSFFTGPSHYSISLNRDNVKLDNLSFDVEIQYKRTIYLDIMHLELEGFPTTEKSPTLDVSMDKNPKKMTFSNPEVAKDRCVFRSLKSIPVKLDSLIPLEKTILVFQLYDSGDVFKKMLYECRLPLSSVKPLQNQFHWSTLSFSSKQKRYPQNRSAYTNEDRIGLYGEYLLNQGGEFKDSTTYLDQPFAGQLQAYRQPFYQSWTPRSAIYPQSFILSSSKPCPSRVDLSVDGANLLVRGMESDWCETIPFDDLTVYTLGPMMELITSNWICALYVSNMEELTNLVEPNGDHSPYPFQIRTLKETDLLRSSQPSLRYTLVSQVPLADFSPRTHRKTSAVFTSATVAALSQSLRCSSQGNSLSSLSCSTTASFLLKNSTTAPLHSPLRSTEESKVEEAMDEYRLVDDSIAEEGEDANVDGITQDVVYIDAGAAGSRSLSPIPLEGMGEEEGTESSSRANVDEEEDDDRSSCLEPCETTIITGDGEVQVALFIGSAVAPETLAEAIQSNVCDKTGGEILLVSDGCLSEGIPLDGSEEAALVAAADGSAGRRSIPHTLEKSFTVIIHPMSDEEEAKVSHSSSASSNSSTEVPPHPTEEFDLAVDEEEEGGEEEGVCDGYENRGSVEKGAAPSSTYSFGSHMLEKSGTVVFRLDEQEPVARLSTPASMAPVSRTNVNPPQQSVDSTTTITASDDSSAITPPFSFGREKIAKSGTVLFRPQPGDSDFSSIDSCASKTIPEIEKYLLCQGCDSFTTLQCHRCGRFPDDLSIWIGRKKVCAWCNKPTNLFSNLTSTTRFANCVHCNKLNQFTNSGSTFECYRCICGVFISGECPVCSSMHLSEKTCYRRESRSGVDYLVPHH